MSQSLCKMVCNWLYFAVDYSSSFLTYHLHSFQAWQYGREPAVWRTASNFGLPSQWHPARFGHKTWSLAHILCLLRNQLMVYPMGNEDKQMEPWDTWNIPILGVSKNHVAIMNYLIHFQGIGKQCNNVTTISFTTETQMQIFGSNLCVANV